MKIDVDCSGCGKRYQVDESLAGKKSRCKDCGNVFRIPLGPTSHSGGKSTRRSGSASPVDSSNAVASRAGRPGAFCRCHRRCVAGDPPVRRSERNDRSQLSQVLQTLRSRCRIEREEVAMQRLQGGVYYPGATAVPPPPPREPAPTANKSPLGLRNFTVIPEEVMTQFEEADEVEFEPVKAVRRAPLPPPVLEDEPLRLTPRRISFPKRAGRSTRREEVDTEVGVTVAGAYGALGILAFIILAIWHAAGEPGAGQLNRVFCASLMIMFVLGMLVASWASIWLLVIAFRDKLEQGLLVLLVPFYPIYYIFSRWRETRGIFAMCVAPICVWISFAFFGGLVLGLAGPRASWTRPGIDCKGSRRISLRASIPPGSRKPTDCVAITFKR